MAKICKRIYLLIMKDTFLEGLRFKLAAPYAAMSQCKNQTNETEVLLLPREKNVPRHSPCWREGGVRIKNASRALLANQL